MVEGASLARWRRDKTTKIVTGGSWQDMKSVFRVCKSLRSRQGLVSKAQWLDEAFTSQEFHRKHDKTVTVSSMAGQVV